MHVLSIALPLVPLTLASACGTLEGVEPVPTPSSAQARAPRDTPLPPNQQARVAFLRKQLVASGYPTDGLVVLDDLFTLVATVQRGALSPDKLSHIHFFFRDPVAFAPLGGLDRQFRCAQVLDLPPEEGERIYKALYDNPILSLTVSVIWRGAQPLVGQQFNSDFLSFVGANTYTTSQGSQRSELLFARPKWVRDNGATD